MKKYFIFAASALALASCSSDDFLGEGQGNGKDANTAINFSSANGAITRADGELSHEESAAALGNNFVIVGFKGSETAAANHDTYAFDHYNVNYVDGTAGTTESNTADWEYVGQQMIVKGATGSLAQSGAKQQTIKYWDLSCDSYDFLAFSMGKGYSDTSLGAGPEYATPTAVDKNKLATAAYTLKGDVNTLGQCYISNITTVEKANYNKTAVKMTFRHATSKVRMALFETVPGYAINDIKFYSNDGQSGAKPTLTGEFNKEGTMTVYFPTTGMENKSNTKDYNVAHINFDATSTDKDLSFTKVNYGKITEDAIDNTGDYLGRTKETASYCGTGENGWDYISVLPAENNGGEISLKIDYTLTATDGTGEKINVKGATAKIPAQYTKWKSGYAYTYIFKISQNTNGTTGTPDVDDKGLTAISFDAVVLEDESNGNQETITTVSDPSITTYGFKDGKVTTDGNEYKTGTDIYATVYIPATTGEGATSAKTVAPQNLYIVSKDEGAAQTINEASVANAIAKGTKDNEDNPTAWTVKDANGKKLYVSIATTKATKVNEVLAEDGHNLEIEALKWTADAAGTYYAVEYTDAAGKKTYKIVKISE